MCPWFQNRIVVNPSDFKSSFYYEITILSQAAFMGAHMKGKNLCVSSELARDQDTLVYY